MHEIQAAIFQCSVGVWGLGKPIILGGDSLLIYDLGLVYSFGKVKLYQHGFLSFIVNCDQTMIFHQMDFGVFVSTNMKIVGFVFVEVENLERLFVLATTLIHRTDE